MQKLAERVQSGDRLRDGNGTFTVGSIIRDGDSFVFVATDKLNLAGEPYRKRAYRGRKVTVA